MEGPGFQEGRSVALPMCGCVNQYVDVCVLWHELQGGDGRSGEPPIAWERSVAVVVVNPKILLQSSVP